MTKTQAGAALQRKRPNVQGQQSIAQAFQAAKRPHTIAEAGKSNGSASQPADTAAQHTDQLLNGDGLVTERQSAASDPSSKSDPITPTAAGTPVNPVKAETNGDDTNQEPADAADAAVGSIKQQEEEPQQPGAAEASQSHTRKASKQQQEQQQKQRRAPAARKPRAKAAAAAAKASAAAAESDGEDGVEEQDDDDADAAAAAAGAAAATAAESASFDAQEVSEVNKSLLSWYDRVQRVLPWRRNPHHKPQQQQPAAAAAAAAAGGSSEGKRKQKKPTKQQLAAAEAEAVLAAAKPAPAELSPQEFAYYVWVSEIMLQQTQVSRVITYFNKWISTWPTVTALAAASQDQVNEVWAGLGYYRRARYLLEGAQHVVNKLGGKFPETAAGLRQIPGVGPYTAAAIASIAFNDQAAAVDGNVIRVLARMRALRGNPTKMVKVWDRLAAQLLHPERPGCHNQAMMELGATVCKPVNPLCGDCPVSSCCAAAKQVAAYAAAGGCPDLEDAPRVTDYPEKVAKAAKAEQHVAVCVLKVLLLPGATTPEAVAAAAAAGAKSSGSSGAKMAAAAAGSSQGSIRSFFKPQAKRVNPNSSQHNDDNSDGTAAAVQQQQQQQQLCEADIVAAGAAAHYLLVQRPPAGLLAGLWEFPGTIIDCDPTPTARRSAVDSYMTGSLGVALPGSSSSSSSSSKRIKGTAAAAAAVVQVVHRRQLGSAVHIFSHIHQTLHAEELVLLAPSLDAVCPGVASSAAHAAAPAAPAAAPAAAGGSSASGANSEEEDAAPADARSSKRTAAAAAAAAQRPTLRWVAADSIMQQGLTSGVRKVLNLALK